MYEKSRKRGRKFTSSETAIRTPWLVSFVASHRSSYRDFFTSLVCSPLAPIIIIIIPNSWFLGDLKPQSSEFFHIHATGNGKTFRECWTAAFSSDSFYGFEFCIWDSVIPAPWVRELLLAMATPSLKTSAPKPQNLCNFQILQNTNQHLQKVMITIYNLQPSNIYVFLSRHFTKFALLTTLNRLISVGNTNSRRKRYMSILFIVLEH